MTTSNSTKQPLPIEIRSRGKQAEAMYEKLLSEGYGHRWAEMCALQQPPGVRQTDRAFMQGRQNQQWLDEMPKDHAQHLLAEAKRAGISTAGKFYMSGLSDKRGPADPAAWVDSVGDVKRVAQSRNLTVSGIVEHKGEPVPPPPTKRLSDRLTKEMMKHERRISPKARAMKDGELREKVQHKYGRKPRT